MRYAPPLISSLYHSFYECFLPALTEPHTFLVLIYSPLHQLPHLLVITDFIPFYNATLKNPRLFLFILCSPNFSMLFFQHHSPPFSFLSMYLAYTVRQGDLRFFFPYLSVFSSCRYFSVSLFTNTKPIILRLLVNLLY